MSKADKYARFIADPDEFDSRFFSYPDKSAVDETAGAIQPSAMANISGFDLAGSGGLVGRKPKKLAEAKDASGHEHKGTGPGGGEFTSGSGSSGNTKSAATHTTLKLKPTKDRAFNGTSVNIKAKLSKQETGKIGESIVLSWLRGKEFKDAGPMNTKHNNFPIDLFYDHATVEIKAGLVSNGPGAQQWRLTIGEPGIKEKDKISKMSPERKARYNARKEQAITERKKKILNELAKQIGKPIKPVTITVLLNPDTKTADIFQFSDWHNRIGWNSPEAKAAYKQSVKYA